MKTRDTHSDQLELIGDLLPTPQEQAELNAYHDSCEREFLAAQHTDIQPSYVGISSAWPRRKACNLAGCCGIELVPQHGFDFGL